VSKFDIRMLRTAGRTIFSAAISAVCASAATWNVQNFGATVTCFDNLDQLDLRIFRSAR